MSNPQVGVVPGGGEHGDQDWVGVVPGGGEHGDHGWGLSTWAQV